MRKQIWPSRKNVKGQSRIILAILEDRPPQMNDAKIKPKGSGEKDF